MKVRGEVNERVSGWMKLDEGSRDGTKVKKEKAQREEERYS